jgi:hypothetical protein
MRKLILLCFTFVLASTGFATTAYAGGSDLGSTQILETADSRKACVDPLIENPFTQFGDYADYVLAPDGNFDGNVTGWQLLDGAQIVDTDKGRSLQIPEDGSVISPSMCLDLHFPTFRMYSKVVKPKTGLLGAVLGLVLGNADDAELRVDVIYHQIANPVWTRMDKFKGDEGTSAGSGWRLTDPIDLQPELGGSQPGARQAALRFTTVDADSGQSILLDDVYVDPMRR